MSANIARQRQYTACKAKRFALLSTPFRKFDDVLQRLFRIWPGALEGAGSLAGGERSEPPVIIKHMNAPLSGCASLFLFYPGVRFAHPRLSSIRPAGADYVTVIMKSCTKYPPWTYPRSQEFFIRFLFGMFRRRDR